MSTDLILATDEKSIQSSIEKLLEYAAEVPWGNSDWQNHHAIVNAELTPERAYRHASLRIMNRLEALRECYFTLRKEEIQIERQKKRIADQKKKLFGRDNFEIQEAELEIEQIQSRRPYTEKLINDAIREIKSLEPVIVKMGKLTREQFEAAEPAHFRQRYHNQAIGKNDSLIGLEHMGIELTTGNPIPDFKPLFDKILTGDQLLTFPNIKPQSVPNSGSSKPQAESK